MALIRRHFLGWDEPLLPGAARFLADRYADGEALVLDGVHLALPGGRAGRRLQELLVAEAGRRRLRLAPPRIVTTGVLPELLYLPSKPSAPPLVLRQAWAAALRSAGAVEIERVFGRAPDAADRRGWDALAGRMAELQREVAGGGHRFADVARVCAAEASDLLFDDRARWSTLAGIQRGYEGLLGELGLADPNLARLDAPALGEVRIEGDLWLVGVAELPTIARRLLAAARGEADALVHAPASEAGMFDEFGCLDAVRWRERRVAVPDAALAVADRPGDQAALALEALSTLGDAATGDIAIAAPDEAVVPYLREWLEGARLPAHWAGGVATSRTSPYRLLGAVADYLETGGWEEFAALVRHPEVEAWLGRGGGGGVRLDSMDRAFRNHLPAHLRGGAPPGASGGPLATAREALGRRLLSRLGGVRPLPSWSVPILELLAELYGRRRLNPHAPADRRLLETLKRIRGAALHLHRLPPPLGAPGTAPDAIRLLLDEIGGSAVPDEPEAGAIELLGWLELALDDSPHVVVTGMNEGVIPASTSADAFLPDRLRTRLGLLDADGRHGRDAYHLTVLLASRETVRLIAGRISAAGDPLRPSRLLLSGEGAALARRVLRFADAGAAAPPAAPPLARYAGASSAFRLPPEPVLRFEPPVALSVTAFGRILEDPYRFALEWSRGLEAVDDSARELDGGAFGSLAHGVLAAFGRSPARASTDDAEVARELERLLHEAARQRYGERTFAAVTLQVEHLRLRLRHFAVWQAARAREGWVIAHAEGGEEEASVGAASRLTTAELMVDAVPFTIQGRIDRVDHHPQTGRWAILDYKTGDRARVPEETHRRRSGEWKDLQLPLYRHLAASLEGPDGRVLPPGAEPELGYVLLPRELDRVGEALASWTAADLREADEAAHDVVRWLREGAARYDRTRSRVPAGDPLAPLLGLRQLLAAGAGADEDDEAEEGG